MAAEPQPSISIDSSDFTRNTRLTVSLKATYPICISSDKFFLTPFASISEDMYSGADIQSEALRLLTKLRPAYAMVLLQEYADALGLASGKTIPEIVRGMCADPLVGVAPPQATQDVAVSSSSPRPNQPAD
jgi:hypothetical protein